MTAVLIIGAGPAGLAAAVAARAAGATVTVLDAADAPGGQYWRHLPPVRGTDRQKRLHHGWATFTTLRDEIERDHGIHLVTSAQVWALDRPDGRARVHALVGPVDGGREPRLFEADSLILATGAHDRMLPFPGWTLPGVFTAGAAQALAKGERVAVGHRVLVAGAGPFLLPVAASLTQVGARVVSVHEASGPATVARGWGSRAHRLLSQAHKFGELAGYVGGHLRHRIPYRLGEGVIAAHGTERVEAVTVARLAPDWSAIAGSERLIEVDALCVGHGFVPRIELAISAGCKLDDRRFVIVDAERRTSVPGVFAAGELTGIGGADAALVEGEIAGRAAAGAPADATLTRRRAGTDEFAGRLEAAHGIRPGWRTWLHEDTLVCRCEEVDFGTLCRTAERTDQRSLRSVKLTARAGLGVCQGRMCGRTVEELLGSDPRDGRADHRPIVTPVRLGELAALPRPTHSSPPAPALSTPAVSTPAPEGTP